MEDIAAQFPSPQLIADRRLLLALRSQAPPHEILSFTRTGGVDLAPLSG